MNIINSNNSIWIGKIFSIKKPDAISIVQDGIFTSKTISTYKNSEISKIKFDDASITNSSDKSAVGTLVGGAIGGALAGGAGAIVGALASGNKQNEVLYKHIDILFADGNWLRLEFKTGESTFENRLDKNLYQEFLKRFSNLQSNPFDSSS